MSAADEDKVRLDKWLWAARFYKTRALANEAIELGRVEIGGVRVKPSRTVRVGDVIALRSGALHWQLTVLALAVQRRPAAEARLLYLEDEAVRAEREARQALIKAEHAGQAHSEGRPTKKARRALERWRES